MSFLSFLADVHVQDTTEFHIHSLEGKVWSFDAGCADEMADWVKAIESQIKKYLEESLLPKRNVRALETHTHTHPKVSFRGDPPWKLAQ